jgi:hypothetical protein
LFQRRARDHDAAWATLRACGETLAEVVDWQEVGLGRIYVEELFTFARDAPTDLARIVFAEAERVAPQVPRLPPVVFDAAAERIGAIDRATAYRARR